MPNNMMDHGVYTIDELNSLVFAAGYMASHNKITAANLLTLYVKLTGDISLNCHTAYLKGPTDGDEEHSGTHVDD